MESSSSAAQPKVSFMEYLQGDSFQDAATLELENQPALKQPSVDPPGASVMMQSSSVALPAILPVTSAVTTETVIALPGEEIPPSGGGAQNN